MPLTLIPAIVYSFGTFELESSISTGSSEVETVSVTYALANTVKKSNVTSKEEPGVNFTCIPGFL